MKVWNIKQKSVKIIPNHFRMRFEKTIDAQLKSLTWHWKYHNKGCKIAILHVQSACVS